MASRRMPGRRRSSATLPSSSGPRWRSVRTMRCSSPMSHRTARVAIRRCRRCRTSRGRSRPPPAAAGQHSSYCLLKSPSGFLQLLIEQDFTQQQCRKAPVLNVACSSTSHSPRSSTHRRLEPHRGCRRCRRGTRNAQASQRVVPPARLLNRTGCFASVLPAASAATPFREMNVAAISMTTHKHQPGSRRSSTESLRDRASEVTN